MTQTKTTTTKVFKPEQDKIDEEAVELESTITELIRKDNGCSAHFRYSYQGRKIRCKLVTFNPKHRSTFLVHECEKTSKSDCLKEILKYVEQKITSNENAYTVTWRLKNNGLSPTTPKQNITSDNKDFSNGFYTSHFYATGIYDLLNKFYYDKVCM